MTSPNQNSVDFFQSSPENQNQQGRRGEATQKAFFSRKCENARPHPGVPSPPEHEDGDTREKADLCSHTVQSIFPRSSFRFAVTQACSGPAVFPQVSNITERGKNSPSTAVTQAKNNPFLVNQMMVSFPSQLQRSMCSFLCCLGSKHGEARRALGRGAGLTHGPGAAAVMGAHSFGTANATRDRSN